MEHKLRVLTSLLPAVLVVDGCLWGICLLPGTPAWPEWLGLAGIAVALGLLMAVASTQRACTAETERRHRQALETQRQEGEKQLARMTADNQAEMNAFRSGLSHSLRMPVAIIQGYAELLTSGMVTEDSVRDEYLRKISDRSQYMTEAISRQLSAGERLTSKRLNYTQMDLLTLLRQAAADMQTAAMNQGVTIQVVSPEERIPMQADAYLLNRVLFNLLENALKYMGRPGVITIRALLDGEQVSLRVQDDGMGLSADETAHIFESNFQGSNHTQGQGYGLYLVKQAVEAHGGTLSAQSAPGQGMGITMIIPLTPPDTHLREPDEAL